MDKSLARRNKHWTADEIEYLKCNWGEVSCDGLRSRLKRSWCAISAKAYQLKLGPYLMNGDYVSARQVYIALRGPSSKCAGSSVSRWVNRISKKGMPFQQRVTKKRAYTVIRLGDFWKFAEENKELFDFSLMEPLALGKEPDWVQEQRRLDKTGKKKCVRWTEREQQQLVDMAGKQSIEEIAERLGRTVESIRGMAARLGLWEIYKPREPYHFWNPEDSKIVEQYIINGQTIAAISNLTGIPTESLRGYCYHHYGSSKVAKAKAFIMQQMEMEKEHAG